ncbi:hypothetical protein AB0J28_15950 [Streptosporangium canum]|uniref:hypothetical protein n=1 Tax=Streptosporangium canum TaxID=324952 RepID=UPI003423E205
MTALPDTDQTGAPATASSRRRAGLVVLAISAFVVVTTELLPVGLLPLIVGERAALPSPHRPFVVTALIQPGGQVLAGDRRQRHGDDRSVADAAASIWECRYRTMAQSASGSPG